MQTGALRPYEESLRAGGGGVLSLVSDSTVVHLDVARWLADVDETDDEVLRRCHGPVLDIGCGPGRFVRALTQLGIPALGVDIAETAVEITRRSGGSALGRSVFEPLPAEGRWPTILLMDGNVGIGGDVVRLLRRVAEILEQQGLLIVECAPQDEVDEVLSVRFSSCDKAMGPEFAWARMGSAALRRQAPSCGYSVEETFVRQGRSFVCLRLRP